MKNKNSFLVFAGLFLLLTLVGIASAAITFSSVPTLSPAGNSATITISSNQNETVNFSLTTITSNGKTITFTNPSSITINDSVPQTLTLNYVVQSGFEFEFQEEYSTTLTATGSVSGTMTQQISFSKNSEFCSVGKDNIGDLKVEIRDVTLKNGFGDEDEWYPLNELEVELRLQNDGDDDVEDISLEWGLYDEEGNQGVIDVDEEDSLDLDSNDEDEVILSFAIDDSDLDVDMDELKDGTYTLYVKMTGRLAEGDHDGEKTCHSDSEGYTLNIEKDFVVLDNFEIPETVQCGSNVQLSADAWNIGSKDQDNVYVKVFNSKLGINKIVEIGDINKFENENLDFSFDVPENTEAGKYSLTLSVYDDNDDIYENSNDDSSVFDVAFQVSGECSDSSKSAEVSAVLQSGGEAGKPLVIKSTIINTGTATANYVLNAAGYASWADSAELSEKTFTLNSGQSKEVLVTLDVKSDAVGDNVFNIEVLSENKLVANQPVSVSITKKAGLNITGFAINSDNWHIWAIGFLNLILVIVIIVIAVRVARK